MKKDIIKLLGEIVILSLFLVFAIPIYIKKDFEKEKKMVENINSLNVTKTSGKLYKINSNNDINDIEEEIIKITNNYLPTNYQLYLSYNKKSSTNLDNLKVKIENNIFSLKDLYLNEDEDNIYFLLENSNINKRKNISFNIWLENDNNSDNNIEYRLLIKKI